MPANELQFALHTETNRYVEFAHTVHNDVKTPLRHEMQFAEHAQLLPFEYLFPVHRLAT